jgi:hypothetical protein
MSDNSEKLKGQLASEFISLLTNVSNNLFVRAAFRQWRRIASQGVLKNPV